MYQNTVYICISWYSKICWFPVKKCWFQQNSRSVSRDSYIFQIFFGYNCAKCHHCRICVTDFREGGLFAPSPHLWAARKKPILNSVNDISSQFTELFNLSFSRWVCPLTLKTSQVIPVYKKDSKSNCSNYRPISLLSNIYKILERLIYNHLYIFFRNE